MKTFTVCLIVSEKQLAELLALCVPEYGTLKTVTLLDAEESASPRPRVRKPASHRAGYKDTLIRTSAKHTFGNSNFGVVWGTYNAISEGGKRPLTYGEIVEAAAATKKVTAGQAQTCVSAFIHKYKLLAVRPALAEVAK